MKRLSRRDLELLGDRVTKAYMNLPENKGKQIFRIDPELLCERLLGLKLDYRHLSEDGSILGLTAFEGIGVDLPWDDEDDSVYYLDGKTVLIESDLRESIELSGRKNFTIAHEASHQILKMVYPKEYGTKPHLGVYQILAFQLRFIRLTACPISRRKHTQSEQPSLDYSRPSAHLR